MIIAYHFRILSWWYIMVQGVILDHKIIIYGISWNMMAYDSVLYINTWSHTLQYIYILHNGIMTSLDVTTHTGISSNKHHPREKTTTNQPGTQQKRRCISNLWWFLQAPCMFFQLFVLHVPQLELWRDTRFGIPREIVSDPSTGQVP